MSHVGMSPRANINRFLQTKPLSSYPSSALKEIKLLSFSRNKTATPFGSYIYRIQKYPGDLDLVEEFTECCSLNDVVSQFEKALQKVVKKINKERLHYFSEVKAGSDLRYDVSIGKMKNGKYFVDPNLSMLTERMFKKKLLSDEENDIIQYIYNKGQIQGEDEYDTIHHIFREHRVLRWSAEEILKGSKKLPGNKKITLEEALSQHGTSEEENHVKIDVITELSGRLVEITNFFQLAYEDRGEIHLVNIDLKKNHDIPVQLPREIEKLYFSNMHYSPFKMIKRMFSLGRHNRDTFLLNKVIPFVSSDTSLLYQIKSEIDTIILIIEKTKSYPKKTISDQLNESKMRISTVIEIPEEGLIQINNMIDDINETSGKYDKRDKLKNLKKLIVAYINMQTINYLQKVGLNPPPNTYLPPIHLYNTNHIRGPGENPENPIKKYQHIIESVRKSEGGYNVYYPVNHHFPNFFENPQSSYDLSRRIISNAGLNESLNEDQLIFDPMGEGGTKVGAWWASFIRRYRNEYEGEPPFDYELFRKLFARRKKYNYPQMLNKLLDSIDLEEENVINIPSELEDVIELEDIIYTPEEDVRDREEHVEYLPVKRYVNYSREDQSERGYAFTDHLKDMLSKCEGRVDKLIDKLIDKLTDERHKETSTYYPEMPPPIPPREEPNVSEIPEEPYFEIPEEPYFEIPEEPYFEIPKEPYFETPEEPDLEIPPPLPPREEPNIPIYVPEIPVPPPPPQSQETFPALTPIEKEEMRTRRELAAQRTAEWLEKNLGKDPGDKSTESLYKKMVSMRKNIAPEEEEEEEEEEGYWGDGNKYSYNYRMPLYMSKNLPIPKIQQNEMNLYPQTSGSYSTDYHNRGYGPSLKGVTIRNAPLVMNGEIVGYSRAGCDYCSL